MNEFATAPMATMGIMGGCATLNLEHHRGPSSGPGQHWRLRYAQPWGATPVALFVFQPHYVALLVSNPHTGASAVTA
jgi:hypothetical protein